MWYFDVITPRGLTCNELTITLFCFIPLLSSLFRYSYKKLKLQHLHKLYYVFALKLMRKSVKFCLSPNVNQAFLRFVRFNKNKMYARRTRSFFRNKNAI